MPCHFYTSLFPAGNNEQKMQQKGNNTMRVKNSLRRLTALLLCLVMMAQTVVVASAVGFSPTTETPEPTAADAFAFSDGEITDYVGSDTNVVIPAAIGGVAVTKIGQAAFMSKNIENVVIPSTVTYVDDYAFDYCDSLDSLYFYGDVPANLGDATYDMSTSVVIYCKGTYLSDYEYKMGDDFTVFGTISNGLEDPAYVTVSHNWKYTDNGDGTHRAMCQDAGCTEVIAREAHTYTGGFCACGAKVNGSEAGMFNYKVLDENAKTAAIIGYNKTGLGGEITLPSTYTKDGVTYTVTTVAADAFNGGGNNSNTDAEALSKITKVTVPASITNVEARGFNYVGRYMTRAWNLEEIVFEAENVTFGTAALGSNPKLTSVTLPSGMTEITASMFAKDTALAALTIPATNPVVLTVKGLDKDGKAVEKIYRKNDLYALKQEGKFGYQYWKGGNEQMVVTTQYVTIVDLLTDAGIDFDKGDSIAAADKTGFAAELTYENMNALKYYFTDAENKEEVPAALALTWDSGAKTLEQLAASAYDSGSIRFCYGVGENEYGTAAGKRLVSGVVTLDVTYCQHTNLEPSVKENENSATCTKDGSYDEVVYCSDCGGEVSRETKTIKAPGHKWDEGKVTTQPTTAKEGVKTFTCTVCQATKTEPIAKLPISGGKRPAPATPDKKPVESGRTYDAGIAVYVGLSLLSLTGGAWVAKKNRKER